MNFELRNELWNCNVLVLDQGFKLSFRRTGFKRKEGKKGLTIQVLLCCFCDDRVSLLLIYVLKILMLSICSVAHSFKFDRGKGNAKVLILADRVKDFLKCGSSFENECID